MQWYLGFVIPVITHLKSRSKKGAKTMKIRGQHHFTDSHILVEAYYELLPPGAIRDVKATVTARDENGLFRRYDGKAVIEYDSTQIFMTDQGWKSFGTIKAAFWNLCDLLEPKDQTL